MSLIFFCAANVPLSMNLAAKTLQCAAESAARIENLNQEQRWKKCQWVPLMLHINRLYPPTLPCCPCEHKNMIRLLYHSANNLPIYISVRSHPPTSPQMSDRSAPSWSWAGPLTDLNGSCTAASENEQPASDPCRLKNGFFLLKLTAVISGPVYNVCSLYKMAPGDCW